MKEKQSGVNSELLWGHPQAVISLAAAGRAGMTLGVVSITLSFHPKIIVRYLDQQDLLAVETLRPLVGPLLCSGHYSLGPSCFYCQ